LRLALPASRGFRNEPPILPHIYRRVANSLFMGWAQRQRRPDHVTTTDFQTLMAEEYRAKALRFVLAKRPSLKNLS